jgi:hypothetical protein
LRQEGSEDYEDFDDCYSIKEIREKLGESKTAAYTIVNECIDNGTCKCVGKRRGVGIDGRVTHTPVYRFAFKNKKGHKRNSSKG